MGDPRHGQPPIDAGQVAHLEVLGDPRLAAAADDACGAQVADLGPLKGMPLVTAGSGVAIGLPQNFGIEPAPQAARLPPAVVTIDP